MKFDVQTRDNLLMWIERNYSFHFFFFLNPLRNSTIIMVWEVHSHSHRHSDSSTTRTNLACVLIFARIYFIVCLLCGYYYYACIVAHNLWVKCLHQIVHKIKFLACALYTQFFRLFDCCDMYLFPHFFCVRIAVCVVRIFFGFHS